MKRDLLPVIVKKDFFDLELMKSTVKNYINELMIITDQEKEFMDRFEKKEYCPELLFDDEKILSRLERHPMALWKMGQKN